MWAQLVGRRGVCVQRSRESENKRQNDHLSLSVKPVGSEPSVFTPTLVCVGVWVGSKLVTNPCSDPHRGNSSPLLSSPLLSSPLLSSPLLSCLPPLLHLTCVVRLALDVNNLQLNNRFTYLFSSNRWHIIPSTQPVTSIFFCALSRE